MVVRAFKSLRAAQIECNATMLSCFVEALEVESLMVVVVCERGKRVNMGRRSSSQTCDERM